MDWYPHHIGDFKAATEHLSNDELVGYLRLIWMYYDKEQPLPNDVPLLARRARSSIDVMQVVVDEFFELQDGELHHGRIDGEIEKYQAVCEQRNRAAQASVKARAQRKKRTSNARSTDVKQSTSTSTSTSSKKPAVFLAPDLSEVITHWRKEDLNGDPEEFFNHFENCGWKLSGGRGAKMKNWRLAASNWSKRQPIFDPRSGGKVNGRLRLPRDDEQLGKFAEKHGLPKAQPGEYYPQYRSRLEREIDRRFNE